MKVASLLLLLAALVAINFARAETSVGIVTAAEHLNNNTPNWQESTVQLQHRYSPRQNAGLAFTKTERFGLRDTQIGGMIAMPFGSALVATIEASASDTHHVLARHAVGTSLQYEFVRTWLLHAGARTTKYNSEQVNQALLMFENYFSSFSWAMGWRPVRAFNTWVHSGELRASHYYGDNSSIGLIIAAGKEAENIGSSVTLTNLRSTVVVGRHRLNRAWTLNYSAGHTRQGDFYIRNGLTLGLQYIF